METNSNNNNNNDDSTLMTYYRNLPTDIKVYSACFVNPDEVSNGKRWAWIYVFDRLHQ